MTHYLCISVSFLDPLFHGQVDKDIAEWPPSPLRLFQALLAGAQAGCHRRDWSDTKVEAFQWLEQRAAPEIVTPRVHLASAYTFFVPDNVGDREPNRQKLLVGKVAKPHRMLDGQKLHYLWSIDDAEWPAAESNVNVLLQAARNLLTLGWGIDMAVGDGRLLTQAEMDTLTGERWRPWVDHGSNAETRRIPVRGTLADLMQVYATHLNRLEGKLYRPPDKVSVFGTKRYLTATTMPPRAYTAFTLEPLNSELRRPAFSQSDIAKVAAMLRHAACEVAKRDSHEFPGGSERYVAGHIPKNDDQSLRFSYLPLPSVGHPHADGMIRRVLIAEPYGSDGSHVAWISRRLFGQDLVEATTQKAFARLARPEADDKRMVAAFTRSSKTWTSVTPVILPGFDEGKYEKALGLLRKAVQQAGLNAETIEDVNLRKAPFWPGSQHARLYFRPDYLRGMPAWHVHLQFYEPVPGPLAIGAGRHIGLGLFVPA